MTTATKTRANWRTPDAVKIDVDENVDRLAWLRERRYGIGGTDAAALMGTHVGKMTPVDVFAEKMRTDEPREADLAHFRFGHLLEPRLMAEAGDHHGVTVRRGGLFRNKAERWRYANPDGLTSDGGILECKTTGRDTAAAHAWREGIVSDHAYDQTQHYLAVTGRSHARFVVGINPPGWTKMDESEWVDAVTEVIHVGPIDRDEERIAAILAAERDFWACVEAGELSTRWKPREVEAMVPEMVEDDIARLETIKYQQKVLAEERSAIEDRLKGEIGTEGGFLTVDGRPVARWSVFDQERFDTKAFKEAHPDLAAEFTRTRTERRFSLVGGDEA